MTNLLPPCLLLSLLTTAHAAAPYEWTCVTPHAPFAPRDGAGALTLNNRMFLIGGWHPKQPDQPFPRTCTNEVWSSSDGATWSLIKPNTFLDASFDPAKDWEGRHTAGYVVHQNKLWIIGGDPIQNHYQPDVWNSPDGKTWTLVNPHVPWSPRILHYTFSFHDYIWVIGGQTLPQFAPADDLLYRDIWRSKDGLTWEQVQPLEPFFSPRGMIGGSAVFHDRIWVLAGGTYDTPAHPNRAYHNDVWSSPDGIHWTRHVEHAPFAPRQYHDVAVFDNRLWLLEGFNQSLGGNRNDVWYSDDGSTWTELPNTPWKPRHASSVFVHDDSLWVVAGNNLEPDVWRLRRTTTRPTASPP